MSVPARSVERWRDRLVLRPAGRPAERPDLRPTWPLRTVMLSVALAAAAPLLYLALRALGAGDGGLALLARPRTLELVLGTLALGLGVGLGATLVGAPLAWLTVRTDLPFRRVWSVLAIAPLAVPSYLLAFAFVGALGPRGWLQATLEPLGVSQVPGIYGLGGTLLVLTLATSPFVVLASRAALVRLDPALEEAARSLGDGSMTAARTAVLPALAPGLGAGALLASLYAVSDFGAVSILRADTLARAIHTQYRSSFDPSGAALLALGLVAIAMVLVWAEQVIRRRAESRIPHGASRVPLPVPLGRWRVPALLFCLATVTLSLVLPILTVGVWLARGLTAGAAVRLDAGPIVDSLLLSFLAASLALLVALPLAIVVVRFPGRWARRTEVLLYSTYAIPGIALALAMVYFTLNVLPFLYQTLAILVAVLALRFLVQPVGALKGPLLQIGPSTLEAARSLGEGPLGTLRTVVLPLARPGLLAGGALVFLSTMKELPLTLLVAPTGFSTLATQLWDAAREGFFAQAAVPAGFLLLVSTASLAILMRQEGPPG